MEKVIVPTVFAHDKKEFDVRFRKLAPLFSKLQIDFMDGKLVPSKGIVLDDVADLHEYNIAFEAHLMVSDPAGWIEELARKGFAKVIFHLESQQSDYEVHALIDKVRENGMEPILAQNPKMSVERFTPFLDEVKIVMFMGHEPGYEKIPFDELVFEKIQYMRKIHPEISIQVDGGVNPTTIRKSAKAGANIFNIGSFVFNSTDPEGAVNELYKLIEDVR